MHCSAEAGSLWESELAEGGGLLAPRSFPSLKPETKQTSSYCLHIEIEQDSFSSLTFRFFLLLLSFFPPIPPTLLFPQLNHLPAPLPS